jgi:hypothetical protein
VSRAKLPDFSDPRARDRGSFPGPGESAHAERTPGAGLGGSRARVGWGRAARGAGPPPAPRSSPPLLHSSCRCLSGSDPPPSPGPSPGPVSAGLEARVRSAERPLGGTSFPIRATSPYLGDHSFWGGEVRASSLRGRFYNLHANYCPLGKKGQPPGLK